MKESEALSRPVLNQQPSFKHELAPQLEQAAMAKDIAEIRRLLHDRANPDIRLGEQKVPLVTAVILRQGDSIEVADVVRTLVEHGADPNAGWTDNIEKGTTALMIAAESDYPIVTKALLDCGADPNVRDGSGRTALERCRSQGAFQMLTVATSSEPLTLFEAIAHAKSFEDPERDRIAIEFEEPIVVEKSCVTCGFYDRSDHTCGEHDSNLIGHRLHFLPDQADKMYCSRWEDEALVGLLLRGFKAPGIAYHRRHPQLVESREKQDSWNSFIEEASSSDSD